MLVGLHVRNLALIDECEMEWKDGLSILTGETGAGKSILIGSINLALGQKADNYMIRSGEDSALVELVFSIDEALRTALTEQDILVDDDVLILRRTLQPGRTMLKLNSQTVTARQIRAISPLLLDLHGQHEHQSLLYPDGQLDCLDSFAGGRMKEARKEYAAEYARYTELKSRLEEEFSEDRNTAKELAITEYEYNEITEADLKPGEEEELAAVCKRMDHMAKISDHVREVLSLVSEEDTNGAMNQIARSIRLLNQTVSMDEQIQPMCDTLTQAGDILNDFLRDLHTYADEAVFDEETYNYSVRRLDLIRHLEDKFGPDIEAVLSYRDACQNRMEELRNFDEKRARLEEELASLKEELTKSAEEIRKLRKAAAEMLREQLSPILLDMNFLQADFEVVLSEREEFGPKGADNVEFRISTNPGEPRKPLSGVASGGEMSRIMLAFKTLLAEKDAIDTMIFDEIDTGISGRTAWKVARRMAQLSRSHQVIAITHLPQIAAMADHHYRISKSASDNVTRTVIEELDPKSREAEVARLLGGDEVREEGLSNARALIEEADAYKAELSEDGMK